MPVLLPMLVLAPWLWAEQALQWMKATVIYSRSRLLHDGVVAVTSGQTQTAQERFDLDTAEAEFTVEEWVVPNRRLRLEPGTRLEFALLGKQVLLRLPDGRIRKLKLVARWPKGR